MLSLETCKKHLKPNLSDEEVLQIRDSLYQMANILVENYSKERDNRNYHESSHILPSINQRTG